LAVFGHAVEDRSPDGGRLRAEIAIASTSRSLVANAAAQFDPATIAAMKMALEDAWNRLGPELQATTLKTTLAERILKSAILLRGATRRNILCTIF
jgi:hypothetical protein